MTQASQGMSENDLPLLAFGHGLKLRELHTLSVPPSNIENILSPIICLSPSPTCLWLKNDIEV